MFLIVAFYSYTMKTSRILFAAAVLLSACVDKELDLTNADMKVGAIAVGDANLYIGQTDTFHVSKFVPQDNQYLRVVDGKYTLYLQDTLHNKMPEVDEVSLTMTPGNNDYSNSFAMDGLLTIDDNNIQIIHINQAAWWIPVKQPNPPSTILTGDSLPDVQIPIIITLPANNKIKSVDTIFYNKEMSIEFDATEVHNATFGGGGTAIQSIGYTDSITLSVAFPKGFKLSKINTYDPGQVRDDSVFVVKYQLNQHAANAAAEDKKQFKFKIVYWAIGAPSAGTSVSILDKKIVFNMGYKLKNTSLSTSFTDFSPKKVAVTVDANLTSEDLAITTMPNIPIAVGKMHYDLKGNANIPSQIKRLDSVMLDAQRDILQLNVSKQDFPFEFSDYTGGQCAECGGVDSGRIQLEFPSVMRFANQQNMEESDEGRWQYVPTMNDLLTSPALHVRSFATGNLFDYSDDITHDEMLFIDSITTKNAVLFLKETSIRKSTVDQIKNSSKINLSITNDMRAQSMTGKFSISQYQDQLKQAFPIGSFKNSMPNIDTIVLGLASAKLKLNIANPTGMHMNNMPLIIKAWRGGTVQCSTQKSLNIVPANNPNQPTDNVEELNNTIVGWNTITSNMLNYDSLTFQLDVSQYSSGIDNQTIFLGQESKPIDIVYRLDVADIVKGFLIQYSDTVALNFGSNGLKGIQGKLSLMLECSNTLPLELKLDVKAFDSSYNTISGIAVRFGDKTYGTIYAGSGAGHAVTTPLALTLEQTDPSGDAMGKLKYLRLQASLAGRGEGDLSSTDYVQIKISLMTNGISVDIDKMQDK